MYAIIDAQILRYLASVVEQGYQQTGLKFCSGHFFQFDYQNTKLTCCCPTTAMVFAIDKNLFNKPPEWMLETFEAFIGDHVQEKFNHPLPIIIAPTQDYGLWTDNPLNPSPDHRYAQFRLISVIVAKVDRQGWRAQDVCNFLRDYATAIEQALTPVSRRIDMTIEEHRYFSTILTYFPQG